MAARVVVVIAIAPGGSGWTFIVDADSGRQLELYPNFRI